MQSRFCTFGQNTKYIRIPCISIDRGLVYIKKVDLFCHNTWMSSTPTPHQKITPSTLPHLTSFPTPPSCPQNTPIFIRNQLRSNPTLPTPNP